MDRSFGVILVALLLLSLVMATAPPEVGPGCDLVPNPIAVVYRYTAVQFRHAAAAVAGLHLP